MLGNHLRQLYFAALLLFAVPIGVAGQESVEAWLQRMDASLDRRAEFEAAKQHRIDSVRHMLSSAQTADARFEAMYGMYDEYKAYCYDSARHYSYACLDVATRQGREDWVVRSKCAIAFSLTSAGILSEAREVLASIDPRRLSGEQLAEYYNYESILWRTMADFVGEEPFYTQYISLSNAYIDSLTSIVPDNTLQWWTHTGSEQMRQHRYQDALESFAHVMKLNQPVDLHVEAMTAAEMAWAYIFLDNEEKAIECFARSAIADNESATREITALYHLARLIYKRGDYDRASRYVHQALEDINFYNTRLRKVEINDILPIIEQDRYNAVRSQRNWFIVASVLLVILILAILNVYFMVRKKNRLLADAHATIETQLEQLKQANLKLKEDNKIKNAYVGQSFYTNAEYIEKVEKLYLTIERKIAARQYEDLRSMLKLSTLNGEREGMYVAFDQTFLKLFPDFVQRYNELFEEKDRKQPPSEDSLTSEMRIFALIRLGITDSERIAKFLNYSVHTVNTYKTRIKNRSTAENDQFEQLIMQI